jgi:dTDP-4-amino-4,6-dideoxygalactose transaminase
MTETRVPFADLAAQWREIADDLRPDIEDLFARSAFCLGPAVERFEREFAAFLGVDHVVGVNSGTSALHLALIAAGVGPGDRVLIPAQTFIATAWAVLYVGAEPVLCDVEAATGTIDVEDAERRIGPGAKAIIPVHLFGQAADLAAVAAFAERRGLTVIEDAAQAHGARFDGRRIGGFGRFAAFSFYPGKNLGAAGEAGAVVAADPDDAERLRSLRNHAQRARYEHAELGFNYRMEGLQGLVLRHKLARLEAWTERRREIARSYQAGLAGLPLELPQEVRGEHVYHLFVVRTPQRDALAAHLAAAGVQTGLHYPIPLNRQPVLARWVADPDAFPQADRWARRGLSLPLHAAMTDAQVAVVIEAVRDFFARG